MSIINPYRYAAPVEQNFYQDIVTAGLTSGLKVCLDAGSIISVPDGTAQDWIDLSGNIGADQFHRGSTSGATSNDPTFVGTEGNLSSGDYYSFDGADIFTYGAASESWMNALHEDLAKFTVVIWHYLKPAGDDQTILSTTDMEQTSNGVGFVHQGTEQWTSNIHHSGGINMTTRVHVNSSDTNVWHFSAVSINEPGGAGSGFLYEDGNYAPVSGPNDTFDANYSSPGTGAPLGPMVLGGEVNLAERFIVSGGRMAGVMIWEGSFLTKANLDTLWAAQKGRFGL